MLRFLGRTLSRSDSGLSSTQSDLQPPTYVLPPTAPTLVAPPGLLCSICLKPMVDPVSTQYGSTYDRACLERWFEYERVHNRRTDPIDGRFIDSKVLYPNIVLREIVEAWLRDIEGFHSKPMDSWGSLVKVFNWEERSAATQSPGESGTLEELFPSFPNETSIERVRRLAEEGEVEAQIHLGCLYYTGKDGVVKNPNLTASWLRKAAEQGNMRAQNKLGVCFNNGEGVPKDPKEAAEWYRKSAAQGDAWAQYNLAVLLENGEGVEKDMVEAVLWYTNSANQGNARAQRRLGICYFKGEGVGQNRKEAVVWFRKAAEQGDAAAQFSLGSCYYYGDGTAKDGREAPKWFKKAAEQGHAAAQTALPEDYSNWIVRRLK